MFERIDVPGGRSISILDQQGRLVWEFPRKPVTNPLKACNDTNDCGDLGPEGLTFVPAG